MKTIITLIALFAAFTAHAEESELWQVWECPITEKQCLLDNGVSDVEADLMIKNEDAEEPSIIYLDAPDDWYIVCYDARDPLTLQYCKYVEVEQFMIDKYGMPQTDEGWETLAVLVDMELFPVDTELDG